MHRASLKNIWTFYLNYLGYDSSTEGLGIVLPFCIALFDFVEVLQREVTHSDKLSRIGNPLESAFFLAFRLDEPCRFPIKSY